MAKKTQAPEEWVGAPRALEILKEVNGREINPKYLTRLGQLERVRRRTVDRRTYEYNVNDLRETRIAEHKSKKALDDDTVKREAIRKEQEG